MSQPKFKFKLVPVIRELNPIDVWEHTPASYYKTGEYPRFIRPVGPRIGDHQTRIVRVEETPDQP